MDESVRLFGSAPDLQRLYQSNKFQTIDEPKDRSHSQSRKKMKKQKNCDNFEDTLSNNRLFADLLGECDKYIHVSSSFTTTAAPSNG